MRRKRTGLPRQDFVVVWMLLMALHALCGAYLLAMARLYFFMENPSMAYVANLLAVPERRRFRLFGAFVGIIGGLHAAQLVLHLASSIQARAFVVWPRGAVASRLMKVIGRHQPQKSANFATSKTRLHNVAMRGLAALEKALSVQGSHFELLFVLRKAVEVAAQIYQCHSYSTLISRVWINEAFVAITATNCVATAILNHLMLAASSRSAAKVASTGSFNANSRIPTVRERTLCVTVDVLLSTISSLVLPVAIFVPWTRKFDWTNLTFPNEVLYDDEMYARLIYENQSIFALSTTDSLLKVVPHGSLLLGLAGISFILENNAPTSSSRVKKTNIVKVSSTAPTSPPPQVWGTPRLVQDVGVSLVFLTASALVLALHIRADTFVSNASPGTTQMCEQSVRPWFAQNVSCSVVKYNCYRQGVTSPAEDALDALERKALASIVFEHCSEFRMPSSIRDFSNLLGLELWNVTLVTWGVEAALEAQLHPKMLFLVMVRVNMSTLPEGVLRPPLPNLLSDFEIVLSNLTTIPEAVAEAWTSAETMYLEHSRLEEFPAALFRLPLVEVSLINSNLQALPADLFTSDAYPSSYTVLTFSFNPLHNLPALAKEGLEMNKLWLSHTNTTTLPAWTEAAVHELIEVGNSPICQEEAAQLADIVECSDSEWNPLESGSYPLAFVEATRQL
ncbi:hypothetical protein PHYPSEUDO_008334 [Phytophthora pseudosyringae]|uniref:Uncharacterized protein n=1 Tax=Phytophthora pseudosyringae TaxID=221518 RepID=A0A8T1VEZ4_9STRA|nr:hypothetical protein PHYPSEUDO_008334 [Phytophthora pseudosyringae]